jgi:biopolymer transport protein ExbD
MVKLVPVLLVSSAFVQLMIVETELPQVVQQALVKEEKKEKPTVITMDIDHTSGIKIITNKNGKEAVRTVAMANKTDFNLPAVREAVIQIKKENPEVFKIEFSPAANVSYKEIVKLMDEVRKTNDSNVKFPVTDEKTGATTQTDYMFPEVVFSNVTDG